MSVTYTCNRTFGDIYGRTATVTVDRRLKLMPSAQAGVIENAEGTHLISYATNVLTVDPEGWMTCNGTYSASTRRHINRFLKEYEIPYITYQTAKLCADEGLAVNIHTGESVTVEKYLQIRREKTAAAA